MKPKSLVSEIGVGATAELSLRVSVATLVRVLLSDPKNGKRMLALERKATLLDADGQAAVYIKSHPFGGAIRLLDEQALQNVIGEFHFDSEHSRSEQDLRIFIRPSDWESLREFCLRHLSNADDHVLETGPERELTEEFDDALGIRLKPDQYRCRPVGLIVEDDPSPTENMGARGCPTVRVYRIFEANILDPVLASALLHNAQSYPDVDLRRLALQNAQKDGTGRGNAVLTVLLEELHSFLLGLPLEARNRPVRFHTHDLDETVAAIFDTVSVPKYRRL